MTDTEGARLRQALVLLRRAVGGYMAKHKGDRCYCEACNTTRAAMKVADEALIDIPNKI